MRIVVLLGVTVLVVATPMAARGVALQPGAKALFYDPAAGQASLSPASPSPVTGLTPVQTLGIAFVGVHYWFENDRGVKFADPASAGLGARVRMHLRGNTPAFLTVWMSDSTHKSLELTTRSDAGPEGRWTGYRLERDLDYVVNGEFEVAPVERATRIIFLLARSQTEQVAASQVVRRSSNASPAAQLRMEGPCWCVRSIARHQDKSARTLYIATAAKPGRNSRSLRRTGQVGRVIVADEMRRE